VFVSDRDNRLADGQADPVKEDRMFPTTRIQVLLALALLAVIAGAAGLGRAPLETWTRSRLLAQQQRQLAKLPAPGAVSLVQRLATDDDYAPVIAGALGDGRSDVAAAAERALPRMVARWKRMSSTAASPHVASLAAALAAGSESLPPNRRPSAHTLARQLLAWPIDNQTVDAGRLIADCETVLRLPLPIEPPRRLAGLDADSKPAAAAPFANAVLASPPLLADPPTNATSEPLPPLVSGQQAPARLIDANQETPLEPRQFLAPRAARISDDQPTAER
jgi:hypothetical protein